MKHKSLVITGADGALGQVVAKKLLADGWTLYASAFTKKSVAKFAELFPDDIHKTVFTTVANLSIEAEVNAFVASAKNVFGLVHLAGGFKEGKLISDYTIEDFDALMDLNTKPAFLLLKSLIPILKKNNAGGAIVTIGAKPALHPTAGNTLYTASKSALLAITLSAAEELRPYNISANCIVPATLQTPNNLSWASEEDYKKFTSLQDVANCISFLVSQQGVGTTGTIIPMYGQLPT